jgi:2-polyprenyl-3-methyl-5-hydroxy-6-metoxy-1,4-benzoquinol methylase
VETLTECPACGHPDFRPYLTCTDQLVSQQPFTIVQCEACTLRFTNPRPTVDQLGNYYKSDQYISHSDKANGLIGWLYNTVRQYTVNRKVLLINELANNKRGTILDIGCGTGLFLAAAGQAGWQIAGVEPDTNARQLAEQRTGQAIGEDWKRLTPDAQYDIVSMWHVLEHIPDLRLLLQTVHRHLATAGTFVVAVPNCESNDAKRYGAGWAAYDVPRHLYHFRPEVFHQLADRSGFQVIAQKPMPFDAYYVSMLSTQHRDGQTNYLEGFLNGWKSNRQARKTGQYSSVMYILKKN